MSNQLLGAGNETNGRPLLGGVGGSPESSSARNGASLPFVGALEAFARVASSYASGFGFSGVVGDFTGGGGNPNTDPGIIDR